MAKRNQKPMTSLGGALQSLEIHRDSFCNLRGLATKAEIAQLSGKDAVFIVRIIEDAFAEYDAAMRPENSDQP